METCVGSLKSVVGFCGVESVVGSSLSAVVTKARGLDKLESKAELGKCKQEEWRKRLHHNVHQCNAKPCG